ncbi:HrpE/YscL family type III secretion apparatus protein [Candidatus Pantoea multigeneris]|uniref:Uncharacterized protein n=1 Tax=Candidatus Pantoea multigeneris TaxID=2608357 RepID=A0ABX0REV2_9GAMM|nr:HrpE/YscL family type III secretion apparatus protein [Pantoea multigeneris]NIF23284.1 hypothetical protein [Pantoea multigeneris]
MKIDKGNSFGCKQVLFISQTYHAEGGVFSEKDFNVVESDNVKIKSTMEYCDSLLYDADQIIKKRRLDCEVEINSRWEEHEREKIEATHREEKIRQAETKKQSVNFLEKSREVIKRWTEEKEKEKIYLQNKSQEMVFEAIYKLMKEAPDRKKIKTLLSHLKLEAPEGEPTVLMCHERQEKKIRDCLNVLEIVQWQVKVDIDCSEYELRLITKDEDLWISWDALMSLCHRDALHPPGKDIPGGDKISC